MKRSAIGAIVVLLVAAAAVAAVSSVARLRRAGESSLPTAAVAKGTFVDYLQLRGEVRPVKSVVLSAPMSGGSDLQIIELARNGSIVNAGDVVVQFDTTVQQRTLEQKQSELKQAESEIEKAVAEQRRREQAAQTALDQSKSASGRAKLDLEGADLRPRVDAEHLALKAADAEQGVRELEQKLESERASAAADVASARQKRDKALFDVRETERTMAGMTVRAPATGPITLLPNRRAASVFAQSAPEFRPGDRAFFGAHLDLAVQLAQSHDEFHRQQEHGEARRYIPQQKRPRIMGAGGNVAAHPQHRGKDREAIGAGAPGKPGGDADRDKIDCRKGRVGAGKVIDEPNEKREGAEHGEEHRLRQRFQESQSSRVHEFNIAPLHRVMLRRAPVT